MSNSSLVEYTRLSPNRTSPRNHKIDTITIHCMAGQLSAESCGSIFAKSSSKASSNYGVDLDGRIAMYVEEKDRSWCSSNSTNDNRAITIEVASDATSPYKVNDKAYTALIKLCVDICKRNNIKKMIWSKNKTDRVNHVNGCNMTCHRDFAQKSCPGNYLYGKMVDIATRVNNELNKSADIQPGWKQDKNGWWYLYSDGTYPANKWLNIDGKDYFFYPSGYIAMDEYVKSISYGVNKKLYYVDKDGVWDGKSYYWKSNNKGWWFECEDGWYPIKEWCLIDGKWYYFDDSGYMVTGKVRIGLSYYTFNADGSLVE